MFMLHTHTQPGSLKHGMEWNGMEWGTFFQAESIYQPKYQHHFPVTMDHITAGSNPAVRRVARLARKGFK